MSTLAESPSSTTVKEFWLTRIVRKRYGIGMLLTLLLWVPAGSFFESITGNVFLLDTYVQLLFLTFTNTIAIVFGIGILRVLNHRFPGDFATRWFGNGSRPWTSKHFLLAGIFACVTPLLLCLFYGADYSKAANWFDVLRALSGHLPFSVFVIALGMLSATIFLFLLNRTKCFLLGSDRETANYLPFESVDKTGFTKKEWRQKTHQWTGLESIDFQLALYFLLAGVFHYVLTRTLVQSSFGLGTAPTATVVLLGLVFLLLAGAANLLDKFRLPVVAVVIIAFSILQSIRESTTRLNTLPDQSTSQFVSDVAKIQRADEAFLARTTGPGRAKTVMDESADLSNRTWDAIVKRIDGANGLTGADGKTKKTLVVVTCPGGGIHAAAWSSFVLEKLCKEYPDFGDSICVISGVSGGSIGAYFFVSHHHQSKLGVFESDQKGCSFDLATQSALEPIAFGMMSDDLYGAFYHRLSQVDRGQRFENSVLERVPQGQREKTLGQWGDLALSGDLPIVIFNATDASSGRRVLFDTIPTPRRESEVGKTSRPFNYRELLSGNVDVRPATAARTSATFPYVAPFTRPSNANPIGEGVALCDGGYVDNEGIVTAVDWLDFILRRWAPTRDKPKSPFQRVLLLRITAGVTADALEPSEKRGLFPAVRWLAGPLETVLNGRGTSQIERGDLEADLTATYLASKQNAASTPVARILERAARRKYQFNKTGQKPALPSRLPSHPKESEPSSTPPAPQEGGKTKEFDAGKMPQSTNIDRPVIVVEIPFDTGEKRIIPLNWKLSNAQKKWYPETWNKIFLNGSDAEKTSELKSLLDRYFRPQTTK